MTGPAVADTNWLEGDELFLPAAEVVIDRPIYQGDVFSGVPLLELPAEHPAEGRLTLGVSLGLAMVLPHPCRCYHGDVLRPWLTVIPVELVGSYFQFREDKSGWADRFGLPGLLGHAGKGGYVGNFGRVVSIPSTWLDVRNRVACLSRQGLGLLAKRVLHFQLRCPVSLSAAMLYTAGEWTESYLMQAWIRRNGELTGYSKWLRTPLVIDGVNNGEPIRPYELRETGQDVLLELISGIPVIEPSDTSGPG